MLTAAINYSATVPLPCIVAHVLHLRIYDRYGSGKIININEFLIPRCM